MGKWETGLRGVCLRSLRLVLAFHFSTAGCSFFLKKTIPFFSRMEINLGFTSYLCLCLSEITFFSFWFIVTGIYIAIGYWALFSEKGKQFLKNQELKTSQSKRNIFFLFYFLDNLPVEIRPVSRFSVSGRPSESFCSG